MAFIRDLTHYLIDKRNTKRLHKDVEKQNSAADFINNLSVNLYDNQLLTGTDMSPNGFGINSTVISGGSINCRLNALSPIINCSYNMSIPVVCLYNGAKDSENYLKSVLPPNLTIISWQTSNYDPVAFWEPSVIINNIYSIGKEYCGFGPNANLLLQGIVGLRQLRQKNNLSTSVIQSYPYSKTNDMLNELKNKGITQADYLKSLFSTGLSARGDLDAFLCMVITQSQGAYSISGNSKTSIEKCVNNNTSCLIRYDESDNIYSEIILKDIQQAVINNRRFILIVDDVTQLPSSKLSGLLSRCTSSGKSFIYSGRDIFAQCSNESSLYSAILSNASRLLVMSHPSGYSCSKWSDFFGEYDRTKYNIGYTVGRGYNTVDWMRPDMSVNPQTSREPLIPPVFLQNLQPCQGLFYDNELNYFCIQLLA